MTRDGMTHDLHTLTGAYALDALDDAERREFEAHLAQCAGCRQRVTNEQLFREKLRAAATVRAPEALRARVTQAVQRELILIKVRADTDNRSRVLETVELFRARVVDVALDAVTVEATGSHDKLEALVRVLEPVGIKELVKSGAIAVGRGGRSITDRALRPLERSIA